MTLWQLLGFEKIDGPPTGDSRVSSVDTYGIEKMELSKTLMRSITLKVVIPKGKQAAATKALQRVGLNSLEDWATSVEGMLMERKAYMELVETRYNEYSSKNGAFIFQMDFEGTEGQLVHVFHTPGLVDALKLVDPYAAAALMQLPMLSAGVYHIGYGGGDPLDMELPPLSLATPLPTPVVPPAPERSAPVKEEERPPFVEPLHRMTPVVEEVSMSGSDNIVAFADALEEMGGLVAPPVSETPLSPAPLSLAPDSSRSVKRLLVDSEDSVLAFDLTITYNVPRTNAGQFEDWVATQWVHFYDAVPLKPNEKKFYDVKFLVGTGVKLTASFHAHIDMFEEIFNDEVLYHLEEVARVCDDETIYVQAPYVEGTGGAVKYEPVLSHYITVGKTNGFSWCFGGCFGGMGKAASPRVPPSQVERRKSPSKAEQRYEELGRKCIELEEEVSQLKERQAALQAQIAEKETRIRMFRFAQDELYDTMEF